MGTAQSWPWPHHSMWCWRGRHVTALCIKCITLDLAAMSPDCASPYGDMQCPTSTALQALPTRGAHHGPSACSCQLSTPWLAHPSTPQPSESHAPLQAPPLTHPRFPNTPTAGPATPHHALPLCHTGRRARVLEGEGESEGARGWGQGCERVRVRAWEGGRAWGWGCEREDVKGVGCAREESVLTWEGGWGCEGDCEW